MSSRCSIIFANNATAEQIDFLHNHTGPLAAGKDGRLRNTILYSSRHSERQSNFQSQILSLASRPCAGPERTCRAKNLLPFILILLVTNNVSLLCEASKRHPYLADESTTASWMAMLLAFWKRIWPMPLYNIVCLLLFAPFPWAICDGSMSAILVPAISFESLCTGRYLLCEPTLPVGHALMLSGIYFQLSGL